MASRILFQRAAAARTFGTSSARLNVAVAGGAAPLPARRPVGALRGGLFGFFFGSSLAAGAVYYYAIQEYKASNDLLTEDIYRGRTAGQVSGDARGEDGGDGEEEEMSHGLGWVDGREDGGKGLLGRRRHRAAWLRQWTGSPGHHGGSGVLWTRARPLLKSPEGVALIRIPQLHPPTRYSTPPIYTLTAMNNFGVIELASTTTKNTPGWAYVPDTGPALPSALQPTNRKRATRNQPTLSLSDLSAREETRIRKDLEALDRDSHKDSNIPIPPRPGGSRAQSKHTPNVRKILQSQKTFANHLDDYQAMLALAETNPAAAAAMNAAQAKPSTPTVAAASKSASPAPAAAPPASKRSAAAAKRAAAKEMQEKLEQEKKKARQAAKAEPELTPEADPEAEPSQLPQEEQNDVEMPDADANPRAASPPTAAATPPPQTYPRDGLILPAYAKAPPRPHPGDADPLLVSYVPPFPADDELRTLMTAPPLSYLEARASWGEEERRYPVRLFCAVCGYWGRVKCMKCGTRVCALECLEAHREECVTRYGL
ncbi:hypothetical protein C8A05DRAFT_11299 [Staphylotrichum tortipilum]|uniref:HIT-type domain-containing protein n=1 Tax=Staphylotrichum tortipilum TaxID=2831512 RepID=A0AAN6MUW6_9PEZI|nr:hypothetical protein C8A05DRAFT_11299 [Staphylotrichum longicolle]